MRTKDLILLEQAYLKVIKKSKTLSESGYGYGPDEDPMYGVPEGVVDHKFGFGDIFDAVVENRLDYDRGERTYTDRRGRVFKYNENTEELEQIDSSQQG